MEGLMDGRFDWKVGWMEGLMDGRFDRWDLMDGWFDGWIDGGWKV